MKRQIFRNIAAVTAIFMVALSAMLIVNYLTVRSVDSLGVVEQLKALGESNAELQEQVRQLDLLARKAYFVSHNHLMVGVYVLVAMAAIFVTMLRLYFADLKNLPQKEIDPIDEWALKSLSRKYVIWSTSALTVIAIGFSLWSNMPQQQEVREIEVEPTVLADNQVQESEVEEQPLVTDTLDEQTSTVDTTKAEQAKHEEIVSKVTFNGFRGNNSNGVSSAKNLPAHWNLSTGDNILWKVDIPRKGYNSPVINGNRVFITGADSQARELYCYELSSGKLMWTLRADNISGSPSTMPKTTSDTGLAASTVATNGSQVAAIFATGDIICSDMDGKRLWAKNLGVPENHYGYASSLLTYGNLLFVQYDNSNSPRVIALNMATGSEAWSKARPDKIAWSSPIITPEGNLVLMGNPNITAYNPSTGAELWKVACMSGEVGSSPCSSAGVVYGGSEYATLIAINAKDGSTLWKASDFLPEVSSTVATKNHVYVATSYGMVAAYAATDGKLTAEQDLKSDFYASPIIAEGKIYLISNSGKMFILAPDDKLTIWGSFDTGAKTFATPAFTDGKVVVRAEGVLYCAQKKS